MIPDERRRQLLGLVTERGSVSVAQLTELLDVSHMTVRRDISLLEEEGRLVSVAGGVSLPSRIAFDASHEAKLGMHPAEKSAIAAEAASRIQPGDVVYLDAGTTTLLVAEAIARATGEHTRTVVTPDFAVAAVFRQCPDVQVQMLGGKLDLSNMATDGPAAARAVADYNIDIAFVSTSSFDLRGLSVPTESKVALKRAVLDQARTAVLVADSSKYGTVAAFHAVPLSGFDVIVTDRAFPSAAREYAAQQGIELLLA